MLPWEEKHRRKREWGRRDLLEMLFTARSFLLLCKKYFSSRSGMPALLQTPLQKQKICRYTRRPALPALSATTKLSLEFLRKHQSRAVKLTRDSKPDDNCWAPHQPDPAQGRGSCCGYHSCSRSRGGKLTTDSYEQWGQRAPKSMAGHTALLPVVPWDGQSGSTSQIWLTDHMFDTPALED